MQGTFNINHSGTISGFKFKTKNVDYKRRIKIWHTTVLQTLDSALFVSLLITPIVRSTVGLTEQCPTSWAAFLYPAWDLQGLGTASLPE